MINNLLIYGQAYHPFCADVMDAHCNDFKADILISFIDIWVMQGNDIKTRWAMWIPVDHDPIPPPVAAVARTAYHRIACSKFGAEKIQEAGMDCDYIPCGVETDVYKPSELSDEERKITGLTKDRFIVGMVAANKGDPPRKAFWQNISAFVELHKKHPDALLYLHTMDGHPQMGEQIDILAYCVKEGLKPGIDVIFPNKYQLTLGYADQFMAKLYSAMDVHMLVSMGEGFGIPLIEAQACGTPVITGDWTSTGELVWSGWKVPKSETVPFWGALQSNLFMPKVGAIVDRLEAAYEMKGNQEYRERAVKGAKAYDQDRIMEKYWMPTLKKIEDKIAGEGKTEYSMNGVKQ